MWFCDSLLVWSWVWRCDYCKREWRVGRVTVCQLNVMTLHQTTRKNNDTNSKGQRPFSKGNCRLNSSELAPLFCNSKFHHHMQNSTPLDAILGHMNLSCYNFKIIFSVVLPNMPWLLQVTSCLQFLPTKILHTYLVSSSVVSIP